MGNGKRPSEVKKLSVGGKPCSFHMSSYCKSDRSVLDHLDDSETGWPKDTRCGCFICDECRPGKPCPQCPRGSCVVCQGIVPPGKLKEGALSFRHQLEVYAGVIKAFALRAKMQSRGISLEDEDGALAATRSFQVSQSML